MSARKRSLAAAGIAVFTSVALPPAASAAPVGSSDALNDIRYHACVIAASQKPIVNPPHGAMVSPHDLCKNLLN